MSTQDTGQYHSDVRQNGIRLNANEPLNVASTATFTGAVVFSGSVSLGAETITSTSANAFAVGPAGTTNPTFNVDASTASAATGLNVKSAAAASGLAVSVLSSGTNENLTIDAKGSGTITLAGTSTGGVLISDPTTVTTASATAFAVGLAGATNPAFNVDASTASSATGLNIKSAAAGAGLAVSVVTSGTNENLKIDAAGNGQISIATTSASSGAVIIGNTSSSGGRVFLDTDTHVRKVDAFAFNVGPNTVGGANALIVDTSTGSLAAGLTIKGAVAGGTVALSTNDSGSNNNLSVAAKGTGTVTFNPAVTATAGGAANDGIQYGSINVGIYTGTGAPTFSAMNGSIYTDSNATTTTTRIYVNKSGAGTAGTTWTALTTAA